MTLEIVDESLLTEVAKYEGSPSGCWARHALILVCPGVGNLYSS
jgi:hypothetical protein